jgi:hypothetical protein
MSSCVGANLNSEWERTKKMFETKFFSMSNRSLGCGDNLVHNIKKQVNRTVVCLYVLLNYELHCFFLQ